MPISVKIPVLFLALIALLAGSAGAQSQLIGDLNKDYKVDFKDLRTLAWQWLDPACLEPGCPADIDGSDGVNMVDYALLAKNWQMEQTHLIISELLASNASQIPLEEGELLDGNGESSDWIEIYNPTSATVSLDGWYLTDNKGIKDKWQFPDGLEIEYGGFLVVFASDKTYELYPSNYPYLDSAGYYHTNFNLEINGEYLALVAPDGNTVIHEYDEYPRQLTDISYGLTQYATTLIPSGAAVSYHVPTIGDSGADWTNLSFDNSGWDTGQTGLGFGIGGTQTTAYNDCLKQLGDFTAANVTDWTIYSGYTSHYTGKLKDFATGSDVGMPTVTFTMGAEGLGKSSGGSGGNPVAGTDAYEIFNNIVDFGPDLVYYGSPGWWVEIDFTGLNPASMYSFAGTAIRSASYPLRKSLFTIMGHNGAVNNSSSGVISKTDNTTIMLAGDNRTTGYIARWDGIIPAVDGSFKVRAEATADSEDGKAYPLGGFMLEGGGGDSELQDDMLGVNASLWSRIKFNVIDPGDFDTLTLRMRYEDGFVAYLNGEKVASSDNAPNPAEWNSAALTDRPNEDSLVFEEFNLMAFLHLLQPGLNVLAIHGLNDNKDNGDFFILPELIAARNRPVPQYFTRPTPGTFNKPGAIGLVEEVWFSHKRGFYDAQFLLTLSTATKDAEIRYTTDSSTPTITHGNIYSTPILIDKITTLRAVAVKPGWLDSDVETHSYYFLDDVITQATDPATRAQVVPDGYPTMWVSGGDIVTGNYQVDPDVVGQDETDIFGGLYANTIKNDMVSAPTISMVMDKDDWFGDTGIYVNENQDGTERVASFEFVNPSTGENFQVNCAIAMQGGVSGGGTSLDRWKVYKLSMRPRFKDSTDDGLPTGGPRKLDYKFFSDSPIEHFDTIVLDAVLNNAWNHSSQHATAIYIQDQCVGDFHNAMGGYSPHGYYAHVYINELYWGMYYIHERPDHSWAAEIFGGEKEEYDAIKHDTGKVINDGGGIGSGSAASNFYAMLGAADAVQADPTSAAKYNTVSEMLDIDNFITYILSHWYGVNWDWPSKNWYATHRHPVGKWRFHTWDAEHSLEWYNTQTVRGLSPYSIHDKLNGNAEYRMRFADIVHKAMYNDGPLTSSGAPQIVQNRMNQVDRPIVGESARWGDTRVSIPHTREDLFNNLNSVLTGFISPRWSFLNNWLKSVGLYPNVAAPVFRINGVYQHGGEASAGNVLTMDAPSGTIYYTTDGSDPREPWTENAVGTPYAPITLTKSTHVKARVLDDSTWSALNEATYAVGPVKENLRIIEIMYHPKNTGNPSDPNKEFIELKNIGLDTLNLNLVSFTEGVDFTFPDIDLAPGACVVVVRDQSAFQSQYGTGVNTAGHYTGSLANDGERIKLVDAIGRTILDFKYGDGWRPITDGDGFSLTIIDPTDQILYGWEEGLVAHWKFDDGMGSVAKDSVGTNTGTLNGDPTWTTGRIGGALSFDGSGDYVSLASIGPLEGDKFTAQAWVNVDASAGVWNPVLMQHDLSNDGCYFYVANDKPSFYLIEGGSFAQAASPETLNADQWYHVAATNDGSDLKLYVDGQLKGSGSSAGMTGVNYNAYIGCEPVSLLYYTGLIDDVRIYNRAVSESEFQDIADPLTRWSQKDSWRASVYRNGTPGWDDSGILPNPGAIVINEVMSHSNEGPDWIELYNTTDDPINIGGWFLSDNNRDEPNLMKYRIANGTIIDGNDYLVFYQDSDFNNPGDPGCLVPFALSENGEKVCLSSHLDLSVMLTGYREIEDFGSSATNVSFGRYFKSSMGNYNFVAMDYNTPDSNNAYPRVGPVVINEIMYNPPTGNQKEEYIELHNITAAPYTLYRVDKSAPWKFTDGIDLTFSSSPPVTIPPDGYLLVVKNQASFTARYGSISGVQIVEGYDGWLSNAGERLQIGMPGDTDDEGTRQYIRIDRVTYSDGLHPEDVPGGVDLWPTEADGLGKSLSRKVPSAYGNDVANWQAASPSPGTANP